MTHTDEVFDQDALRVEGTISVPFYGKRLVEDFADVLGVDCTPVGGTLIRRHFSVSAELWDMARFLRALSERGVNVKQVL